MWKLSVKLDQDGSLNDDIKAVLIGIIDKYENLVPQGPPLGYKEIEIMPGGPMCTINFLPKYYQILLSSNAKSRFYCQVAYQFAHELCHIYCDPRIFNRFIESICELSSLYFLEYLSNKWGIDPPYPHWKSYAQNFATYKTERINTIRLDLKEYSDIRNIMKETGQLDSVEERNLQLIAAKELLPIFQGDSKAWLLLADFGRFSKPQPKAYNELVGVEGVDWDELGNSLPIDSKKIVDAILRVNQKE